MNPGIVFSSFTSTVLAVDEEVHARQAVAAGARERLQRELAHALGARCAEMRAGTSSSMPPGAYFASKS